MRFSVTTWNINSVRLRIDTVAKFLKGARPDVLCLQETKCIDDAFPLKRFKRLGYEHVALNGQKGYHGVAIGDLNVAPHENDVWSHKQLLKVVSHTPVETEKLLAAQAHGEWFDIARERIPMSEKVYTWWSYRAADWTVGDRGRRLDHIWVSRALKDQVSDFKITRDARSWERPSDHVPVTAVMEV